MIKLFTHTDLDGIGCAVLATFAFSGLGVGIDIEYCNYDDIESKVEEHFNNGSEIMCHITDISISEELADKINNSNRMFQLLDHHATALNLNKFNWCNVQIENKETHIKTSGTEMYYHWLIDNGCLKRSETLDKFVELIRDYDTWRLSTLGYDGAICKQVNDLLYIYGRKKFIDWCLYRLHYSTFPNLEHADRLVLKIEQNNIDNYIKKKNEQMITVSLCGKTCGAVFAEKYFSELGNKLCQMNPEIDFVAMIDMNGTVSYRTVKDDINLGKDIAKLFGGGGHPKVAGSRFTSNINMEVIKGIFGCNVDFAL